MNVNLTPIYIVFGIGAITTVLEHILSKSGNETLAKFVGVMGMLVSMFTVWIMAKNMCDTLMTTWFPH